MIYPTIQDLTKGKYNRYELAIATAKGARFITDEYVRQRAAAESAAGNGKESEKPIAAMIDKKLKDEKAVKLSIDRLDNGEFVIIEEAELAARQAAAAEAEETEEVAPEIVPEDETEEGEKVAEEVAEETAEETEEQAEESAQDAE